MTAPYSDDQDLLAYEPDILRWLPETQADYLPQHNESRKYILNALQKDKVIIEESDLGDTSELRVLSVFKTLQTIFGFLSANEGDSFDDKSMQYSKRYSDEYQNVRDTLSVDADGDGFISNAEKIDSHQTIIERW